MSFPARLPAPPPPRGPPAPRARGGAGRVVADPPADTEGRRGLVVGAEEDLLASRVQQLRELVELPRPAGFKDVLAVLAHQIGAERATAEQPHGTRCEFLAVTPGERHSRLEPVEHIGRAAEDDRVEGPDFLAVLEGRGLG